LRPAYCTPVLQGSCRPLITMLVNRLHPSAPGILHLRTLLRLGIRTVRTMAAACTLTTRK